MAIPPSRFRSSVPDRSQSRATIRKTPATTSPWLTIWSTDPSAPSARRLKIPRVMNPSWAIDEYPAISRTLVCVKAITEP